MSSHDAFVFLIKHTLVCVAFVCPSASYWNTVCRMICSTIRIIAKRIRTRNVHIRYRFVSVFVVIRLRVLFDGPIAARLATILKIIMRTPFRQHLCMHISIRIRTSCLAWHVHCHAYVARIRCTWSTLSKILHRYMFVVFSIFVCVRVCFICISVCDCLHICKHVLNIYENAVCTRDLCSANSYKVTISCNACTCCMHNMVRCEIMACLPV